MGLATNFVQATIDATRDAIDFLVTERQHSREDAHALCRVAVEDNAKEYIQVIVVMAGLPGTGKSTLAEELAAKLGGVVVSKDRIRDAAFGPLVDYSAAQDDFCMELAYRTVRYLRETRPGVMVAIDGRTYSRRAQVNRLLEALPEMPRWIECVCDEE